MIQLIGAMKRLRVLADDMKLAIARMAS